MSGSTQYLHQLTWLRGFAAFLVVISHTIRATEVAYTADEQPSVYALAKAFDLGNFGVLLFFTLSGATLYISSRGTLPSVFGFYVKRFFRIWPAFFVALLFYMAFAVFFRLYYVEPQGYWIEQQFLSDYTLKDLFAYITLTANYHGQYGLFNNAFWSLPVEFQFYLIFPLVLLALTRIGVAGPIAVGATLLAVHFFFDVPDRSSAFFRLAYSFCGGVLLGYVYSTTSKRFPGWLALLILPAAYTIVAWLTKGILPMPNIQFLDQIYNIHVFFSFLFMAVCMFTTMKLPNRIQQWLEVYGTVSYSTYLYHNLVIGFLTLLIIHLDLNNGLLRYLFMVITTLLLTHLIALASYKLVEMPSVKLAKKMVSNTQR